MGAGGRSVLQEEHLAAELCVATAHRRSIADAYVAFIGQVDHLPEDTYGLALYALERACRKGPGPLGVRKNLQHAPFVTSKAKHAAICNEAQKILAGLDGYERKVLPYCPQPLRRLHCRKPVPGQEYPPTRKPAAPNPPCITKQQHPARGQHNGPAAKPDGLSSKHGSSPPITHSCKPAPVTQPAAAAGHARSTAVRPQSARPARDPGCGYDHLLLLPQARHVPTHLRVAEYYRKERPVSSPGHVGNLQVPCSDVKASIPAQHAAAVPQAVQQAPCAPTQAPVRCETTQGIKQEPDVYPYRLPSHQSCETVDDNVPPGVLLQLIKQHRRAAACAAAQQQALQPVFVGACHAGRSKRVIPTDEQVAAARRLGIPVVDLMDSDQSLSLECTPGDQAGKQHPANGGRVPASTQLPVQPAMC